MDPRWQSTTHVQQPDPVPLSDVPEHLRVRLVELVLDQVSAGHWTALDAAEGLSSLGFCASAEKVKAALSARDRLYDAVDPSDWISARSMHVFLVSRLARPVGGLTRSAVA